MTYTTYVMMAADKFLRINNLLTLEDLASMTDEELLEHGANTDTCEYIFCVYFKDGSTLTYDLCSGTSNYYDNMVFCDPEGNETTVECDFELGETIEIEHNGNTYIVNIVLQW